VELSLLEPALVQPPAVGLVAPVLALSASVAMPSVTALPWPSKTLMGYFWPLGLMWVVVLAEVPPCQPWLLPLAAVVGAHCQALLPVAAAVEVEVLRAVAPEEEVPSEVVLLVVALVGEAHF